MNKGAFGNSRSKKCKKHKFFVKDWELRKCIRCGAVNSNWSKKKKGDKR